MQMFSCACFKTCRSNSFTIFNHFSSYWVLFSFSQFRFYFLSWFRVFRL